MLYNMSKVLYSRDSVNFPWVNFVHNTLNSLGLSYYFLENVVPSPAYFKSLVNTRLKDQFQQNWHNTVESTSKCLNYRIYKESLEIEKYFSILPLDLSLMFCKFRCMGHKMPIEIGRYMDIERNLRYCHLCDKDLLGDEFHYLFDCMFFNNERKIYLKRFYWVHPNAVKFKEIMCSSDKTSLLKLAIFCKKIMSAL